MPPASDPDATLAHSTPTPAVVDPRAPAGYVIERELGRGGMGVVYLARHLGLNRPCALKMILSGAHSNDREIARFKTEAQAIARLQHPGIVQVFEIGEHDGRPFMALELCGGGSLDATLAKNPLAPKEAARLVRALAEAVHAAHQAKVIHRDLKPANVLLTERGEPKVTDFGLAKKLDEDGATRTGAVMGTPSYMPPEQAKGKKDIGPAADIYALGAILYECLASRPPFRAATPLDTLLQALTEEPVPLRQLNATVPIDLETVCHKCLQKDPTRRYARAQDLADDLDRFLNGEPIAARPVGQVERAVKWVRRNPVVSALLTAVVLVLTAGIVVSWAYANEAARQAREAANSATTADSNARTAEANSKEANENATKARQEAERASQAEATALDRLRRMEWSFYAGKLLQAQNATVENQLPRAFTYLEECQWDLRGWEYRHLRRHLDNSKQTLRGHTQFIVSVSFSPDGKRIVTGSSDGTVRIWDAARGTELLTLKGHTGGVFGVAWSPDGKRILSGGGDLLDAGKPGEAKVWDADNGQELRTLPPHTGPVHRVAFSPDSKRLLTTDNQAARLWDTETGAEVRVLKTPSPVRSVAFGPDGKHLLMGAGGLATVWDAETGNSVRELKVAERPGGSYEVTSAAWSPDGKRLLTGDLSGKVTVWDAVKGTRLLALGDSVPSLGVQFSPDGQRLLAARADGIVKVWEAEKGAELFALTGHKDAIWSLACSPDGRRIVTGSADRTARVWNLEVPPVLPPIDTSSDCIAFSPDGKLCLTDGLGRQFGSPLVVAKVWDAEKGTLMRTLKTVGSPGPVNRSRSVAFSRDGKRLLTGTEDGTAKVWDADKGTELLTLRADTKPVTSVTFSPDGKRFLTACGTRPGPGQPPPGEAKLWDAEKGTELLALRGHSGPVNSVAFSRDGKRIVTGSADRTARVWDAATGAELLVLKGHTQDLTSACFSPDGKRILTGAGGNLAVVRPPPGEAKVWDAQTGADLLTLKGHAAQVISVGFSNDGKRILTASRDTTAKIWEVEKGTELLTLKGHTMPLIEAAFSADDRRILSACMDRKVKVWDADLVSGFRASRADPGEVGCVAWSPDGKHLVTGDANGVVNLWDAEKGTELLSLMGNNGPVTRVAFGPDSKRLFAWDATDKVLAWTVANGKPVAADNPPPKPGPDSAQSPDGRLAAKPDGNSFIVIDRLPPPPEGSPWPSPDAAERKRYHSEQVALSEKEQKWFAVAFHLGRLLLDDPDNAALKKRRDGALQKHATPK